MDVRSTAPVPPPGCPAHSAGGRVPLYVPEFAADPQAYYAYLRHFGPTAPVDLAPGVPATLVTDYQTALRLLQDPANFRKDSRRWRDLAEGNLPVDSPVVPTLTYRPNALFSDGAEHLRLRQAITDTMARIDTRRLARSTEQVSNFLMAHFGPRGSADLLGDYAKQVSLMVFNELFGCPADIGDRVMFGTSGMFEGKNAEQAVGVLFGACGELVQLKRRQPGDDVTSWLLQHHAKLTDEEMVYQLALLLASGTEPLRNLIGNTLHRVLTDDGYANKGGLIDEAIDDTLWENPPMANFAAHYAASDLEFAGQHFRAGDLLLIGIGAANTSPALAMTRTAGSRAHLAWSAGPHACPSKEPARQIAITAIENLLNRLPDVVLAVPEESLTWRPGPFSRGLAAIPARFTPVEFAARTTSPQAGEQKVGNGPAASEAKAAERGGRWSQFLNWIKG